MQVWNVKYFSDPAVLGIWSIYFVWWISWNWGMGGGVGHGRTMRELCLLWLKGWVGRCWHLGTSVLEIPLGSTKFFYLLLLLNLTLGGPASAASVCSGKCSQRSRLNMELSLNCLWMCVRALVHVWGSLTLEGVVCVQMLGQSYLLCLTGLNSYFLVRWGLKLNSETT